MNSRTKSGQASRNQLVTGLFLLTVLAIAAVFATGCAGTAAQHVTPPQSQPPTTPGQSFAISGTIGATAGSGTTVALSGTAAMSTMANASGAFSFTGLANGSYTVTPSRQGYTFSPTTQLATVNGSDVSGINFTATAQTTPTYTISGTITPVSAGSGATVILDGTAGGTTTANSSGSFTFSGLANGTYTVIPNRSGFLFSPTQKSVTLSGANVTGVDFAGSSNQQAHSVDLSWTATPSTVSGYNIYRSTVSGSQYVKINSSLVGSTNYSDSTVAGSTTYFYVTTAVDSSNNESSYSNEAVATVP
jgi:hypothetical protein